MGWLTKCLPLVDGPVGLRTKSFLAESSAAGGSKERAPTIGSRSALADPQHVETTEVLMTVIIDGDPRKATHTAVSIDRNEAELGRASVRATRNQGPAAAPLGRAVR
jgi:hypothetical protein